MLVLCRLLAHHVRSHCVRVLIIHRLVQPIVHSCCAACSGEMQFTNIYIQFRHSNPLIFVTDWCCVLHTFIVRNAAVNHDSSAQIVMHRFKSDTRAPNEPFINQNNSTSFSLFSLGTVISAVKSIIVINIRYHLKISNEPSSL